MPADFKFDEIGYWSELKLEIIKKHAAAYTKIITATGMHPFYIDGFAGAGIHVSKKTGEYVPGSPLNALKTQPSFEKLFLIDLNTGKANHLREIAAGYKNVYVYDGDCNSVLLEKVFPECRYERFQRALCVLDPYGLHLSWEVMREAARKHTIEVFLNFPVQDMNRNVIWRNQASVSKGFSGTAKNSCWVQLRPESTSHEKYSRCDSLLLVFCLP